MAAEERTMSKFTRYALTAFYTFTAAYLALWVGAWWYTVMVAQ